MRTHLLTALVAAAVAVALVPAALAAGVRVRVEGQTQTIFGAAQPALQVGGTSSALDALEGRVLESVKVQSAGPGAYVVSVAVEGLELSVKLDRAGARIHSVGV